MSVNDEVLTEGKQFTLKKEADGAVRIFLIEKRIEIYMTPPNSAGLIYPGSDKPMFWFNGHKIQPSAYTVMSHMKGQYPGVTIRFFGSVPIRMLQFIPRIVDERAEKIAAQKKDYDQGLRTGFDMDYFKHYGLTPQDQED